MKRIAIISAVVLMVLGLALMTAVLVMIGFDFGKLDTATYQETTFDLAEGFTAIKGIKVDTADVRLVPTTDGTYKVVCYDREDMVYSATVVDGALTVSYADERNWIDHLQLFSLRKRTVTVYAPAGAYGALVIEGDTGDVQLPKDFSFERIDVAFCTGDITCSASSTGEMKLRTTTGDIDISGVTVGSLTLNTTTGDITARRVTCTGAVAASVSSGDVELSDLSCRSLVTDGSTGELEMEQVLAEAQIKIVRTTGDVELEDVDAATLDIETGTGDVTGTLRSMKRFDAHASTGQVRVPENGAGGSCKIRTGTGDITIRISGM